MNKIEKHDTLLKVIKDTKLARITYEKHKIYEKGDGMIAIIL